MMQLPMRQPLQQPQQQLQHQPQQQHQRAPTSTQAPTFHCLVRGWRVQYRLHLTLLRSICHLGPICHPLRHSALRLRTGPHRHGHLRVHRFRQPYRRLRIRVSCRCSATAAPWTHHNRQAGLLCGSISGRGGSPPALLRASQTSAAWKLPRGTSPRSDHLSSTSSYATRVDRRRRRHPI